MKNYKNNKLLFKNQQSNFIEPSIKKKSEELHELYCKELKYRISLSLCRDWSNYSPYISPEIINKIGIQVIQY